MTSPRTAMRLPIGRTQARPPAESPVQAASRHPVITHLAVLAASIAAGLALTWPRFTYLIDGRLQATRDAGTYVWDFWWMAHQVGHLGNPWYTRAIAAPVGAQLGYHALMPLAGVVMMPVTVLFGPSASYNLLSVLAPGLLCYAMYRAARLWLNQPGAIAAGAFFGLSSDLTWHAWYQLNLVLGALFLPLALEAAIRLRRRPGWRQAVFLGVVTGCSLLTDQESAVMVAMLAVAALLPWLLRRERAGAPGWGEDGGRYLGRKLAATAAAAAVTLAVASPQIVAMAAQTHAGGAWLPARLVDAYYVETSTYLPGIFAVSPEAVRRGLSVLAPVSYTGPTGDGVTTFGLVLSVLAVLGLAVSWRRRSAWLLAVLWLGTAALALGPTLRLGTHTYVPAAEVWNGVRVSRIMPFTWLVQIPGMAGFREAPRFLMLALVPAALLAGAAVDWLRRTWAPLLVVVAALGLLEAGWSGNQPARVMPTAMPAVDRPIAADHSRSIVVDVPFGVRGGVPLPGEGAAFNPQDEVLATADGHPRAIGYLSRLPVATLAAIRRQPFYAGLLNAQVPGPGIAAQMAAHGRDPAWLAGVRSNARRMDIGWVIVWRQSPAILRYLAMTGFRPDYRAGRVVVYRSAAAGRQAHLSSHLSSPSHGLVRPRPQRRSSMAAEASP